MKKFTPQAPLADIVVQESDWQEDDQLPVDSPPDNTQIADDVEHVTIEVPENNYPPSQKFPEYGGAVEQTTQREDENHNEVLQEN